MRRVWWLMRAEGAREAQENQRLPLLFVRLAEFARSRLRACGADAEESIVRYDQFASGGESEVSLEADGFGIVGRHRF